MGRLILASIALACLAGPAAAQIAALPATSPASSQPDTPPSGAVAAEASSDIPKITYAFKSQLPPFRDKTVGVTALTAGLGSLSGVAGAFAMARTARAAETISGSQTSSVDEFPNPENLIAADVAKRVAASLGASPANAPADFDAPGLEGSRAQKYAQLVGTSRYLVDVQTGMFQTVWASYATWPLDLKHYIVEYMANVTIYDAKVSREIFSGRCFVFTKRTPNLPTHDELFANSGEILKTFIREAADDCVSQLVEKNDKFRAMMAPAPAS